MAKRIGELIEQHSGGIPQRGLWGNTPTNGTCARRLTKFFPKLLALWGHYYITT